jgi:hypothetical protein
MLDETRGGLAGWSGPVWRVRLATAAIIGLVAIAASACEEDVITTVGGIPDTLSISVVSRSPGGELSNVTELTLAVGETTTLGVTALNALGLAVASPTISWMSTASGVASVSGDGVVTGVSPGDAFIIATAGGASTSLAVTVTEVAS